MNSRRLSKIHKIASRIRKKEQALTLIEDLSLVLKDEIRFQKNYRSQKEWAYLWNSENCVSAMEEAIRLLQAGNYSGAYKSLDHMIDDQDNVKALRHEDYADKYKSEPVSSSSVPAAPVVSTTPNTGATPEQEELNYVLNKRIEKYTPDSKHTGLYDPWFNEKQEQLDIRHRADMLKNGWSEEEIEEYNSGRGDTMRVMNAGTTQAYFVSKEEYYSQP